MDVVELTGSVDFRWLFREMTWSYSQTWSSLWQNEHTGCSPGHLDFFLLILINAYLPEDQITYRQFLHACLCLLREASVSSMSSCRFRQGVNLLRLYSLQFSNMYRAINSERSKGTPWFEGLFKCSNRGSQLRPRIACRFFSTSPG